MRFLLIITAFFVYQGLQAQKPATVKQKRISIGKSGCTYLNFCDTPFKPDYSSDSSRVYSGECVQDGVTYGVICVQLKKPVEDLKMAEDLMIAYVDYLKQNFTITEVAGYSKGFRLNNNDSTRGITDYWVDGEQDKWKIRAWTNGKYLGFLYAYSQKLFDEARVDEYFEGFRFGK